MKRDSSWTSGTLDLLEASDPVRHSTLASAEIEDVLDEIGNSITDSVRRTPRRRSFRHRRTVLVVATAAVLISAAVATGAVMFSAHTGLFATRSDARMGGPGEELNPAASDFRKVALQIASDIPYPKGYESWRDWTLKVETPTSNVTGSGVSPFPAGLVSSGALHGWFAASAFCAWVQSWRQAVIAADASATAQAAQTISQAPGWKAVTDEDPRPDPSARNDPGAVSGTLFGWMLPYRDAVRGGDRNRVEQLLATGYGNGKCWLSDPDWMAEVRAHRAEWGRLSQSQVAQKYEQFLASVRS